MIRIARSFIAVASSLVWPAAVVAIPLGITFSAARVFAEAGIAPPPKCTDAEVTACADAGPMQACACGSGYDCACTSARCSSASGVTDALVCQTVVSACRRYAIEPCAGKKAGASCEQTAGGSSGASGTCEPLDNGCLELNDAGFYDTARPLACRALLRGPDAGPSSESADTSSDSGCSASARARGDATLLAIPVALGLALASRRRRRR